MASFLDQIRIFIEQIIQTLGYTGIAAVMFTETIIPPIPSEVVMPFAGFLVAAGKRSFLGVVLAGDIGAISGAMLIYYLGYLWGEERVRNLFIKYGKYVLVNVDELDNAMELFERYGKAMVFFGRMIPGIRSVISLPAGIKRMGWGSFLFYTIAGTTLWNILLAGAGYFLGSRWQEILVLLNQYENFVYALIALFVVFWVGRKAYLHFRKK